MSAHPFLLVEQSADIAVLTINRPDKLNALSAELILELTQAFESLSQKTEGSEAVRAIVLTGAGKAFVAGADIAAMATMSSASAKRFSDAGHALCALIETLPMPVIAAVNGFALGGGCELALACDFIFASENAKFGQPEVNLAVIPGFGGTQRLARRVGIAKARELIYTGDMITAEQALSIGLANAVFPLADLLPKARETAAKIASKGPLAIAAAKRVLLRGETIELNAACELEAQAFALLFGTEDQRNGMRAFLEKSKTAFAGR